MTDGRMTLAKYLAQKPPPRPEVRRPTCDRCQKALVTCYCHLVKPFDAPIEFIILQHPGEVRNPIATARMAHLTLSNSEVIEGFDFAGNGRVQQLLDRPGVRNVLLYPKPHAEPLDDVLADAALPGSDRLVVWVIDAKWSHVNKLLRNSPAIRDLPATAFQPDRPSRFCVRTQPGPACVSTVEAIHAVLARRALVTGDGDTRHQGLLDVFRYLVSQQLGFCDRDDDTRHSEAKRKRRERRERLSGSETKKIREAPG